MTDICVTMLMLVPVPGEHAGVVVGVGMMVFVGETIPEEEKLLTEELLPAGGRRPARLEAAACAALGTVMEARLVATFWRAFAVELATRLAPLEIAWYSWAEP